LFSFKVLLACPTARFYTFFGLCFIPTSPHSLDSRFSLQSSAKSSLTTKDTRFTVSVPANHLVFTSFSTIPSFRGRRIMDATFARPIPEVLAHFDVDATSGLKDTQVAALRAKHGKNC